MTLQVPGPETLEVKRKIEKKKAKKAAGWTKSEEMSDHVQMSDISDILNFVGEKNDVETSSQGNTQKKKLRKKLSSKQKSGTKNTLSNGKTEGPSSTSSDSEDNIDSAIVRNGASVVTGKPSQQQSLKGNKPAVHGASALMSNGYMAGPGEIDNSGALVNSENEFTEVLHRKKKAPNKTVTMGAGMERNGKTPNHHQYDRPQIPRNNVRPASNQGMYGKTPDNTTNKPSPSLTKPDIDVDLSINSFPALGPQLPNGDAKFSSHNESTSATDDDKDSVSSQPFVPGPSWAKIAAKPTINTTPVKVNTESITPRLVIPVESAAVVAAVPRELEVTLPDLTSHQFPDLTSKTPAATAALTSTTESPSDILNNPCVSSISNVSSEAQPKSICGTASATVSQEQTNTEDMSSSTSSLLSIEFGTVTSSSDWQSNQRVQHILSQSYSEGFGVQSIPNNKTQTVPRTVKPSAGNSAAAAISSRFMPSLSSSIKGCSSKGVQFLDRPSGMPSPNQHIDITFGFHSDDDLPSTGASAQNIDSQINTSMSMSYPPPSKSITSLPAKVEPSSSAVDERRPESAQPPAAQPAVTCQPLTAAAGGIKSTNNTTRHRDDKPGASASVAANILHNIMSMECNHKPVRSTGNVFKTAVGMDNCDGFDVLATIKMLRKGEH